MKRKIISVRCGSIICELLYSILLSAAALIMISRSISALARVEEAARCDLDDADERRGVVIVRVNDKKADGFAFEIYAEYKDGLYRYAGE